MRALWRRTIELLGSEGKVLLVVAAALLAGEVGMRLVEERLSKDVSHLKSFGQMAESLVAEPGALHVLFLGNSMTRYGVAQETFEEEFRQRTGRQLVTAKFNPDNTALADWFYAYRNFFFEPGRRPDVMVLGFEGGHLRDRPSHHPGRLAHYYCDGSDWNALRKFDLKSFDECAAFLLAQCSSMFSNRDRIQTRVLDLAIPRYREGVQELNVRQKQLAERIEPAPTYSRLREFLEMVRAQGVEVVLAAMPIREPYQLDQELLEIISSERIRLVDCRNIPGIVPEMFPDGVHMTADASQIYSRFLADQIAGVTPVPPSLSQARPGTLEH